MSFECSRVVALISRDPFGQTTFEGGTRYRTKRLVVGAFGLEDWLATFALRV